MRHRAHHNLETQRQVTPKSWKRKLRENTLCVFFVDNTGKTYFDLKRKKIPKMVFNGQGIVFYIGSILRAINNLSSNFHHKNVLQKRFPCVSLSSALYKHDTVWNWRQGNRSKTRKTTQVAMSHIYSNRIRLT